MDTNDVSPQAPRHGDVVIVRDRHAELPYRVNIVPKPAHLCCNTCDVAWAAARLLAARLDADYWYVDDPRVSSPKKMGGYDRAEDPDRSGAAARSTR